MSRTLKIATPARKPRTKKHPPTQDEIQLRAYQIFLERNGAPGNEFDDWIRAEKELVELSIKGKPRRSLPRSPRQRA